MSRHAERGQTLPFWTIAIGATLTLLFFVANYASTVRWQIRAQNAADSAASAGIGTDANMYNQASTIEFAAAVDETRMRYLIQAIANTVNNPSSCGSSCDAYYAKLVAAYNTAAGNYSSLTKTMQKGDNLTEGGLKNSADKAVGLASSNCTVMDCAFTYTSSVNGTAESVDVVTCKKVPFIAPALMGGAGPSFTAVGRSVAVLAPINEAFVPGNVNPATNAPFQPD
ncbi:MAG TPA: pilus assembly protein TadG-related protein, partial [Candidatus Elarobacter sp.]